MYLLSVEFHWSIKILRLYLSFERLKINLRIVTVPKSRIIGAQGLPDFAGGRGGKRNVVQVCLGRWDHEWSSSFPLELQFLSARQKFFVVVGVFLVVVLVLGFVGVFFS